MPKQQKHLYKMAENQPIPESQEVTIKEELELLETEIRAEEILFNKATSKFLKRHKKGEIIPKEDQELHVQHRKLIVQLEKYRASLYKLVYPKGIKSVQKAEGKPDMEKIKSMPNTISAIVRKIV